MKIAQMSHNAKLLRQLFQRSIRTVIGISKFLDAVAEAVGERKEQPVVCHAFEISGVTHSEVERSAHFEIDAAAQEHERDVIERMVVPLAELVAPYDQRVIEQAAIAARLGRFG